MSSEIAHLPWTIPLIRRGGHTERLRDRILRKPHRFHVVFGAAYSVVLMHNHPSGDPVPSQADTTLTRQLVEAGRIIRVEGTDHVIIGHNRHCSLREAGII